MVRSYWEDKICWLVLLLAVWAWWSWTTRIWEESDNWSSLRSAHKTATSKSQWRRSGRTLECETCCLWWPSYSGDSSMVPWWHLRDCIQVMVLKKLHKRNLKFVFRAPGVIRYITGGVIPVFCNPHAYSFSNGLSHFLNNDYSSSSYSLYLCKSYSW